MIHHYINLVCWREMQEMYDPDRDIVWIDSVSIRKLVAKYRHDAEFKPGTSVLQAIGPKAKDGGSWFFLTAGPVAGLPKDLQFELPIMNAICVPDDLAQAIGALASGTRVAIGISAPKQNRLAAALHDLRPDLEYHCLGAAVSAYGDNGNSSSRHSRLSGSGIEWLRFLVTSPKRTWSKIEVTLKELWLVRTHSPSRIAFEKFSHICAPARPLTK